MDDLRLAELISSRLCHDLISPLSAIQNGLELIEDLGDDMMDDALGLMGQSSRRASAVLQVFRMALGRAGDDPAIRFEAVRDLSAAYFTDSRITPVWQITPTGLPPKAGLPRAALNMMLVGQDALHLGGTLTFTCPGEDLPIIMLAEGRDAGFSDDVARALAGKLPLDDATARNVHAYFFGKWCVRTGLSLRHELIAPGTLRVDLMR